MTAGRQAFGGQAAEAVSDAILHRDPVPIREVNPVVPAELEGANLQLPCFRSSLSLEEFRY
jgi:hypothetical protein